MSDEPFVGEIALFPYNFVPRGWAACNGQTISLTQNTALFALIGTIYGGNGTTNFALPNLNGRVPVGAGQGPGLSGWSPGTTTGTESVTLTASQLPAHAHPQGSREATATSGSPATAVPATSELQLFHSSGVGTGPLSTVGGSQAHNNMQPYLTLQYAIALVGIYPSRP